MGTIAYQLRGTSGSGKTTVARALMEQADAHPTSFIATARTRKPELYVGTLFGRQICFLGSYENVNGGCDTIRSVKDVSRLLRERFDLYDKWQPGIIFFEGLMISHMLGTVGQAQIDTGQHRNVLAFLDTPRDTCVERVIDRRIAAGNQKPFDPHRTLIPDWSRVHQSAKNAIVGGYTVTTVDHTNAVHEVITQIEAAIHGLPIPGHISSLDQYPLLNPLKEGHPG